MKKIEAYVRPEKLDDIKEELKKFSAVGLSVTEIMGYGKQKGWKTYIRGTEVEINFLHKIKLEIVVTDEQTEEIIDAICQAAYTGEVGDGKIFISDVLDAVRIRTKERGESALK